MFAQRTKVAILRIEFLCISSSSANSSNFLLWIVSFLAPAQGQSGSMANVTQIPRLWDWCPVQPENAVEAVFGIIGLIMPLPINRWDYGLSSAVVLAWGWGGRLEELAKNRECGMNRIVGEKPQARRWGTGWIMHCCRWEKMRGLWTRVGGGGAELWFLVWLENNNGFLKRTSAVCCPTKLSSIFQHPKNWEI